MTNPVHSRGLVWWVRQRASSAALSLAIMLVPAVVATQSARAQTFTVLHSFAFVPDGDSPFSSLVQDAAANLYGTTSAGGISNACPSLIPPGCGVVFKVDPQGNESVLYNFTNMPDGANPTFGLVIDGSGNLYGTTGAGGGSPLVCYGGCGVVFKVDPNGTETVLYRFAGGNDGGGPTGVLARDLSGNLYGTTIGGGVQNGSAGFGVVYKLDPSGHETVLYSFKGGADGGYPAGGVIRDLAGNLYGTGWYGGAFNEGVMFKIDTSNKETVLYSFTGHADGGSPFAGLVQDPSGNLYGTTEGGGVPACLGGGCGVVFKLDTTGKETVLHTFTVSDGALPELAGLVLDAAGNLYGATYAGGTGSTCPIGCGVVFKLDTTGKETVLYSFSGGVDGLDPGAGVLLGASGNLYGTTLFGGASGLGTVFELSAPFSLSASALTPSTVSPGGSATSTVNLTVTGGFSGTVTLTCLVQPKPALAPQCSVPISITPGTPATLTVTTTKSTMSAVPSGVGNGWFYATWLPLIGIVVAGTGFGSERRRKEKALARLLAGVLVAGLFLAVACGGSSGSGGGGGGTPAGQYTIIITGTSSASSLGNSTTTTLTVQ